MLVRETFAGEGSVEAVAPQESLFGRVWGGASPPGGYRPTDPPRKGLLVGCRPQTLLTNLGAATQTPAKNRGLSTPDPTDKSRAATQTPAKIHWLSPPDPATNPGLSPGPPLKSAAGPQDEH